jgi:hypothetical protein
MRCYALCVFKEFMRSPNEFMLFDPYEILVKFLAVCCIICDGICREGAIVVDCE